ncbi:signal peptidase I [Candidatus Woesearchaeota archaeon]|nr:signal peptidase I [Candidatus Woesearchaeota archaeon]
MEWKKFKPMLGKAWRFIWEEDSIWSWLANIVLAFVLIKFIVYPGLGFVFNTKFPIVAVVSGSMDHALEKEYAFVDGARAWTGNYLLCGKRFSAYGRTDEEKYWGSCGRWYEQELNVSQENFSAFPFSTGFKRGDIMILFGKRPENIKVGDVIVFRSSKPDPIIHRVVKKSKKAGNEGDDGIYIFQTKGDHNSGMIKSREIDETNIKSREIDETNIKGGQIIGNAVARVPLLGYVKIWFVELMSLLGIGRPFMS